MPSSDGFTTIMLLMAFGTGVLLGGALTLGMILIIQAVLDHKEKKDIRGEKRTYRRQPRIDQTRTQHSSDEENVIEEHNDMIMKNRWTKSQANEHIYDSPRCPPVSIYKVPHSVSPIIVQPKKEEKEPVE